MVEQTLTPNTATSCSDLDVPAIISALATLLGVAEDKIVIDNCPTDVIILQAFGIVAKILPKNYLPV